MPTKEPVLWVNMALSIVRSGLLLLLSLGAISVTQGQQDAILQFAAVALPAIDLGASAWIRSRVKPVVASTPAFLRKDG